MLHRPELLSRIGDNIVVFDFISEAVGRELVVTYMSAVTRRVKARHGIALEVSRTVVDTVADRAVEDLSFGGRGVGSIVETMLVNPLTRALASGTDAIKLTATHLELIDGRWRVTLGATDGAPSTSGEC